MGQAPQCNVVIVINPSGSPTIAVNPNAVPLYDGDEDTLVGVQNLSGQTINALPISGSADDAGENIFDFDGDGACSAAFLNCHNVADPTGYAGPTTSFSNIDESHSSGTVNFIGGARSRRFDPVLPGDGRHRLQPGRAPADYGYRCP